MLSSMRLSELWFERAMPYAPPPGMMLRAWWTWEPRTSQRYAWNRAMCTPVMPGPAAGSPSDSTFLIHP